MKSGEVFKQQFKYSIGASRGRNARRRRWGCFSRYKGRHPLSKPLHLKIKGAMSLHRRMLGQTRQRPEQRAYLNVSPTSRF